LFYDNAGKLIKENNNRKGFRRTIFKTLKNINTVIRDTDIGLLSIKRQTENDIKKKRDKIMMKR